jgi:RNA polymerase sigma-70 factor (ECF subfamily)
MALAARPVVVNGTAGIAAYADGQVYSVAAFTVVDGRIVAIDIVTDQARLRALGL